MRLFLSVYAMLNYLLITFNPLGNCGIFVKKFFWNKLLIHKNIFFFLLQFFVSSRDVKNTHTREICVNRNETHLFLPVEYCELKIFSHSSLKSVWRYPKKIFFLLLFPSNRAPASSSQFLEAGKCFLLISRVVYSVQK